MLRKFGSHLRNQWMGALSLFLILGGGTAWAVNGPLAGKNTVGSADIINREVKEPDLADNAVTGFKIAGDSVSSSKVANNSLDGEDIAEGSLGQVPSATLGGFGRSVHKPSDVCSPTSVAFIDCGFTSLNLPAATRVLISASAYADGGSSGACRLVTSSGVVPGACVDANDGDALALTAVTGLIGPGSVDFGLECRGGAGTPDPSYFDVSISAVALSPN